MKFGILGSVEVSADGRWLPDLAPRHRTVLAYLLLNARTVIGFERLTEAIWGAWPPATARSQIHASVTAIRRVLREAGVPELLATQAAGYVLTPEPGSLDLEVFADRVAGARTASAGEPAAAASELRAALALWRGVPLADVSADYVADARLRLAERRLGAVEALADLELAAGRGAEIIELLQSELALHPLRESLAGRLMLALHRAGRQTDALAVARTLRSVLADQQGLDPGRAFVAVEQAVLRDEVSEPAPAPNPAPTPVSAAPEPARPSNYLPFDVPDFAGREAETHALIEALTEARDTVAISSVDGMAGVGKTAFAVHAAHRLAAHFPDGQLFVDLQAYTADQAPLEPAAALETLLRQLGVPAERIPISVPERAALWRAELTGRRVLVVLDNASGTDHVLPLLPGASATLVLITSRRRLTDLDGARCLSLDLLPAAESVELFTRIVGDRARAEPVAALDVLHLCGFLPLAIRIAAARLRHRPGWTVAYLASRLRDERRRLAELATADRGVAAAFSLSYQQIHQAAQRMFRLAGLNPGRDLDAYAAAALAGLSVEDAEGLLEELVDGHVMMQPTGGRYAFHDLLRGHARSTALAEESPENREAALDRLLGHYVYTALEAIDVLYPYSRHIRPRIPAPESQTPSFDDAECATAWLDAERANLLAAAEHAAAHGRLSVAAQSATILRRYLDRHGHHAAAFTLHGTVLHASRRDGARGAETNALLDLGVIHFRGGRYDEAADHYRSALTVAQETGDRVSQARARYGLGVVLRRQWDHDAAADQLERALVLYRELGERLGEAAALGNLGIILGRRGAFDEAHDHLTRALTQCRDLGNLGGVAVAHNNIGLVYRRQGRPEEARDQHRRALALFQGLGYRGDEAVALNGLGEADRAAGDPAAALAHHGAALARAEELGNRPERGRAHLGLARAHRDLGASEAARDHGKQAWDTFRDLGVREIETAQAFLDGLE